MVQPWVVVRRRGTARERRSRRTRAHVRALRVWNHWENYLGGLRLNWENYLSGLRRRRMEMLAACSTQAVEGLNSLVQRMSSSSPSISLPLLDSRVGMRHSSSSTFRQYAAEYAAAVHSKAKEADGEEEGTGIEKREKTFRDFFCGPNPMGEALSTDESLR